MFVRSVAAVCLLCFTIANPAYAESGVASVYGYHGSKTASGERANPNAMTVPIARFRSARALQLDMRAMDALSQFASTIVGRSFAVASLI